MGRKKRLSYRILSVILSLMVVISTAIPSLADEGSGVPEYNNDEIQAIKTTGCEVKINDKDIVDGTELRTGDAVKLKFNWTMSDEMSTKYPSPAKFVIDLSDKLKGVTIGDTILNSAETDKDHNPIAQYIIKGQTLTVYLRAGGSLNNKNGYCNIDGVITLNDDEVNEDGKFTLEFFDKTVHPIATDRIPQVNDWKSAGEFKYEDGAWYQYFTIGVQGQNANSDNVIIKDTFPSGENSVYAGSVLEGISYKVNDMESAAPEGTTITYTEGENSTTANINIGELKKGDKVEITYKLKINADKALDTDSLKTNKVKVVDENDKEIGLYQPEASANPSLPTVSKDGELNTENKTITWTIYVDANILDNGTDGSEGFVVTDTLGDKLDGEGLVDAGATANSDGTYTIPKEKFTLGENGSYSFTYTTKVSDGALDSLTGANFKNDISVKFDDADKPYTAEKEVTYNPKKDYVDKYVASAEGDTVTWSVKISVPDIEISGITLADNPNAWVENQGMQELDLNSFTVTDGEGNICAFSDAAEFTPDTSPSPSWFSISLKKAFINANKGKDVVFSYKTNLKGQSTQTYRNKADLNISLPEPDGSIDDSDTADYTKELSAVKNKMDNLGDLGVNSSEYNYPLGWSIKIASTKGNHFVDGDVITITDTLPEHYDFINSSVRLGFSNNYHYVGYDDKYKSMVNIADISTDESGHQVVTLKVTLSGTVTVYDDQEHTNKEVNAADVMNTTGYYMSVAYATAMEDDYAGEFSMKEGAKFDATNKAEVKLGSELIDDTEYTQSVTSVTSDVVDKYFMGSENTENGKVVTYKVEINKKKLQLGDGESPLTAEDVFGNNLTYIEGSVTGISADRVEYDQKTKTLKFTLEDKTAYTIEYKARVKLVSPDITLTDEEKQALFGNTVTVSGKGGNKTNKGVCLSDNIFKADAGFSYDTEKTYVNIIGTKTWADQGNEDKRPETISFVLTQTKADSEGIVTSVDIHKTVSPEFELDGYTWKYAIIGLIAKDNLTGDKYTYSIKEVSVDGYSVSYESDTENITNGTDREVIEKELDLTNTYNGVEMISVDGTKTWEGDSKAVRPSADRVKLSLYANGEKVDNAKYEWTDNGNDTWSYVFENLPKEDDNGDVIIYTVKEDAVDGYFAKYDGSNITNVYNVTSVSGEKTWDDDSDKAGVRPTVLSVILSANGNVTNETAIWDKHNDGDTWSYTFSNLPKYDENGELIKYTVEETVPDGYVQSEKSADGLSFTNKTTSVKILKTNEAGKPLAGAALEVLDQNDKVVDSWISDGEAHETNGLKVGEKYTLKETKAPDGSTIAVNKDFTVPESGVAEVTMKDGITKVRVTKTASDTGKPLAGAVLQIKDSTGKVVEEWTTTEENNPYEFNGRFIAGAKYTLHEVSAPEGYKVAEDIDFTVNTDGMVNDLVMSDIKIEVEPPKPDSSEIESSSEVVSEVESSEPESSEVESSEPESSEVESSAPESSEPESSAPESSELESSAPESSEPESSAPESSEPESSAPESSEVESSEPESSEVESSELDSSDVDSSSTSDSSSSPSASSSSALKTSSKASDESSSKTPNTGLAGGAFATAALALAAVVATNRKNSKDE